MKIATMKNCGCVIQFEYLHQTNDHQYRCPNHHNNGIDYVEADCAGGCGKTLTREHGPYIVIKCKECQDISRKAKDKEYYNRYYKKKTKAKRSEQHAALTQRRNHNFDPSLYTMGLSRYLRDNPNE